MLETRDLYKVYKPKKGVAVTALNKVSLKFPEKGMVFLLGKSGSGKSTMLNLLGGLDKYDSGEIIIKGVSSKDFNQQHFDSYRNTYVGFIFQEYNVLDEFSVGANIALALELQGRKATDEEINEILKKVDLDGYGNRKPNELSGGQKQRVAIARALVKNPEIIMADEPTGALDSNTGRQVFDTLKKLSKDKLVIIVSHDREFSELYADRIIELADGNVISDMEVDQNKIVSTGNTSLEFKGDIISVAPGYHLTEDDRTAINEYIDKVTDKNLNLKLSSKVDVSKRFVDTDQSKINIQDGSSFKLIKSKLPLKSAFKIGSSSLKHKKIRLAVTIILSCIAFGLFGLADTFGSYNHVNTCTNSLVDTGTDYVSVKKAIKEEEGVNLYWSSYQTTMSKEELKNIEDKTGVSMTGVVEPLNLSLDFSDNFNTEKEFTKTNYNIYLWGFHGFAEITQDTLDDFGYKILAGTLPDGNKDEIAISEYTYETFKIGGYTDGTTTPEGNVAYKTVDEFSDLIGETLTVGEKKYTISAIIDTKFDLGRYKSLTEGRERQSTADDLVDYVLMNEYMFASSSGFSGMMMVGDGYTDALIENQPKLKPLSTNYIYLYGDTLNVDPSYMCKLSDVSTDAITWLNGEKTSLGEKEIIVSSDTISYYGEHINEDLTELIQEFGNSSLNLQAWMNGMDGIEDSNYKIVGVMNTAEVGYEWSGVLIGNDEMVDKFGTELNEYTLAIGAMPESKDAIKEMVEFCYDETRDVQYQIQSAVTYELDTVNSILKSMSKVFLYIGIGFALFASLMLANFIGTSISYKKQEIGILRAIGSRSNDVFRIFFSESFVIAMINFVLSSVGVGIATFAINTIVRDRFGILVTILNFGPRQILLLFVVSMVIAAIASFVPVKRIASKRPIDAIRNK